MKLPIVLSGLALGISLQVFLMNQINNVDYIPRYKENLNLVTVNLLKGTFFVPMPFKRLRTMTVGNVLETEKTTKICDTKCNNFMKKNYVSI